MAMRRFQKPTIKDVATRAGVSVTTVSEFLNGRAGACSVSTAGRIRAAIDEVHYTPGSLVNGLRNREAKTIGSCLRFPIASRGMARNSFSERLWIGVMEAADNAEYALMHYPANIRDDDGNYRVFLDGRVDGVLMGVHHNDPRPAQLDKAGMPTVVLGFFQNISGHIGCAYINEMDVVSLALTHLWDFGHRRIAHLTGPVVSEVEISDIAVVRRDACVKWLQMRGVFDPALIFEGSAWGGDEHAAQALNRWMNLPCPPTAILGANDHQARNIIAGARAYGLSVPQDLSVVGIDNEASCDTFDPPLTSVDIPGESLGQSAMEAMFNLMRGASVEDCRIIVPVKDIMVRVSTRAIT